MKNRDIRQFFEARPPESEPPAKRRVLETEKSMTNSTTSQTVPPAGEKDSASSRETALKIPLRLPEELRFSGDRLDIGRYDPKRASQKQRYEFLTSFWRPEHDYHFNSVTQANRLRTPQYSWLTENPTLAFSHVEQGFYCSTCCVFADVPLNGIVKNWKNAPKSFVNLPYRRFKDFKEDYKTHLDTKYHKLLVEKSLEFAERYNNGTDVTSLQLAGYSKQVKENRIHLTILAKVLYLLAKLELPLRGTNDYGPISEKVESEKGVFLGVVSFLVKNGLPDADLLVNRPANAQYLSPIIQNDLLSCISKVLLDPVIDRIKHSQIFTLMLDETSAFSTEYLSVVLRSVDETYTVQEDFLGFLELSDQTAESIFEAGKAKLMEIGLDMANIVAQGYDGAATMSGCRGGVQALLRAQYPEALFFHCAAHKLNLVVTEAAKWYHPELLGYFHHSTKASTVLRSNVDEMKDQLNTTRKHLPSLCPTRWVERHEAFVALKQLMPAVVKTLSSLEGDTSADSLLTVLEQQFKMYAVLYLMEDVAQILKRPAELLQQSQIELIHAFELIEGVLQVLQERANGSTFEQLYSQSVALAEKCNCPISVKVGRSTVLEREIVKNHYKQLYVSVYSIVLKEMHARFGEHQSDIVLGLFSLVPGMKGDVTKLRVASTFYSRFLPSPDTLDAELDTWRHYLSKAKETPKSVLETLRLYTGLKNTHPNIHRLLLIAATLPVSTASVERSFSALSRILTDLRSSMKTYRLTDLSIISYYATTDDPDYEKVLDEFKRMKTRRIHI